MFVNLTCGLSGSCNLHLHMSQQEEQEFLPTDIDSLHLWLDATDTTYLYQDSGFTTPVTSDGDRVGGWQDRSGNGRHWRQTTAGLRMYYDSLDDEVHGLAVGYLQPMVSNDYSFASGTGMEIIAVLRKSFDDPGNSHFNWQWNNADGTHFDFNAHIFEHFGLAARVHWVHGEDLVTNKKIYDISASDNEWIARLDGEVSHEATPNWSDNVFPLPRIGNSQALSGRVRYSEILLFDRILTAEERTNVVSYLTAKHATTFNGILDEVGSAAVAYSLRLLTGNHYLLPVVRLREDNGDTERDFWVKEPDANGVGELRNAIGQTVSEWLTATGASNAYVVTWYDQVGTNNASQSTSGNQPLYSSGNIDYNGTNHHLDIDSSLGTTACDLWFVAQPTNAAGAGDRRLFSHTSGATTQSGGLRVNSGVLDVWPGVTAWETLTSADDTLQVFNIRDNGATLTGYRNGVEGSTTGTISQDYNTTMSIGELFVGAHGARWDGYINEFILYSPAISDVNRALINTDLLSAHSIG